MSADALLKLQSERDALKENLDGVNQNIKKLTGRDPHENRRLSATSQRRFQLKRTSLGSSSNDQPPEKRAAGERRRLSTVSSVVAQKNKKLDSEGEEEDEEKKPAIHSSVVATGKPVEVPKRPMMQDKASVNRNRRMLGVLMGTLRQFKRESQIKSEQESKREEKLTKVEEQVKKEQEDAQNEKRELFETRRNKQEELRKLEFKIDMTELNVELKKHYDSFQGLIQLRSTPRLFYKPAKHNEKTRTLLEETKVQLTESLEQRLKEIEMCTEEDIVTARSSSQSSTHKRRESRVSKDVVVIEPVQTKRDLFEEDQDNDIREREADSKEGRRLSKNSNNGDEKIDKPEVVDDDDDDDVVFVEKKEPKRKSSSSETPAKVMNGSLHHKKAGEEPPLTRRKVTEPVKDKRETGGRKARKEEDDVQTINTNTSRDSRRVVSQCVGSVDGGSATTSFEVTDERVVKFGGGSGRRTDDDSDREEEEVMKEEHTDDDVNIYEDVPQDLDLFQGDDADM